jgi:hypothetical protein
MSHMSSVVHFEMPARERTAMAMSPVSVPTLR